jgi:UDP-glucose 4-epimerase
VLGIFGGGFIGQHLIEELDARGLPYRQFSRTAAKPGCQVIDFERPDTYAHELASLKTVVLLISQSSPATFLAHPDAEVEHNVLAYSRFFRAIETSGVKHVVYLSSGGTVYGATKEQSPLGETHQLEPTSYYGCAKVMIEALVRTSCLVQGRTYTILRPANPVGTHQLVRNGVGVVAAAIRSLRTGIPFVVWGDGGVVRDYFDVRDLCEALIRIVTPDAGTNQIYNVSSGVGRSILEVLDQVSGIAGVTVKTQRYPARSIDVPVNVLSSRKIREHLGWQATTSFDSTIAHMLENFAG